MIYFLYFSRFVLPLQQLSITPVPEKPVLRTARIFRTTGGCCVPGAPENAPRTREGGFRYRISLPYHRSPFFAPSAPENASRTTGGLFAPRAYSVPQGAAECPGPLKMRRVPQEPVFCTARIFRTTGGLLRYRMCRMPQMAGERSLFPRRNHRQIPHKCQEKGLFPRQHYRKSNKHQKKRPLPKTAPSANFPQPQSRGSREIFIQAAVLPRMDLTIF